MTPLAWHILMIFLDHAKQRNKREDWYNDYPGYIAGWTMNHHLEEQGIDDDAKIDGVSVRYPHNDSQRAMKELIDLGLIREMPNLGERFELVVKEPVIDSTPQEPTIAEYWTQPPRVQGHLRKSVEMEKEA